jgi:hypothetical protein
MIMNGTDTGMPIMLGLFKSTSRFNLGDYEGKLTLNDARNEFFKITKSELNLSGEAQKIGSMKDAWGHPQTGWEKESSDGNKFINPIMKPKKTGIFSKLGEFFS